MSSANGGLGKLGFGPSGVAAGSVAAGLQSDIGNVPAGGPFAQAQSQGALGVNSGGVPGGSGHSGGSGRGSGSGAGGGGGTGGGGGGGKK
nr:uncharacterized protein CI109_003371 [Kwoniella shandongensis]KAA5528083.1 hypothetical protein CI109_003371 [Kwoniella shandongensis]